MIATTVDVVALAHIVRKRNQPFLVNVSGKTAFPAASGTDGLATRLYFWRWNLYSLIALSFDFCKPKGHLQSAVLAVLQGFSAFNAPKLQD